MKFKGLNMGKILLTFSILTGLMVAPFSVAYSASEQGQQQKGKPDSTGQKQFGKPGTTGGGSQSLEEKVLDDGGGKPDVKGPGADSDAPPWAGPSPTEPNPHQQGGGKPTGAGTKKGDEYGDLWVVLRDANGVAILFKDADGDGVYDAGEECTGDTTGCYPQPYYLDANGNVVLIQLDAEGSPVNADLTQEVEFGRLNIGRSPTKVVEKALDTAMTSILGATSLSLDDAGRIVLTLADGTTKTIDAPLENISLYIALLTDGANLPAELKATFDSVVAKLSALYTAEGISEMDLTAALLAAGADKTGTISLDLVAYLNAIYGIADMTSSDFVDYSTFDYNRAEVFSGTITYQELQPDGSTIPVTGTILDLVFGGVNVTDASGIDAFAQAADDALKVIAFIHDPIHDLVTEPAPPTPEPPPEPEPEPEPTPQPPAWWPDGWEYPPTWWPWK
jgi:hypothetical protein